MIPADANFSFRRATLADVDVIVALVNSAYRGASSRKGWTTEADLLDGQRTDAEEISGLVSTDDSMILLCARGDEIIGSVHLQRLDAETAYMGMLVVRPGLQGKGLGKKFIIEAERTASVEWQSTSLQIWVITLRHELIAYYERLGYRRTGQTRAFPTDPRYGIPKVGGLMFEILEKKVPGASG